MSSLSSSISAMAAMSYVATASLRAKAIMQRNKADQYPLTRFKGYAYYLHNPSLDLWQPIEQILKDCGIL